MTSSRPYLIRALYEWINDNDLTPYILVDTRYDGLQVPSQHIQDNKVVLNIAPRAIQELDLGNDYIMFSARFSGVSMIVRVPIAAVISIYAMETGQGMVFSEQDGGNDPSPDKPDPEKPSKPTLRVIK